MWRPRRPPLDFGSLATPTSRRTKSITTCNITIAAFIAGTRTVPACSEYATDSRAVTHALPPSYFFPSMPRGMSSTSPTASDATFDSSSSSNSDHNLKAPDERTLQLGRTIRVLQERMPTLLHTPLPTEILSPSITLHLFPSTHPHLPVVRGRVAYIAALWTAPIAWRRLPGGSTRLEVVSERMLEGEVLRIRWRAGTGSRADGPVQKGTTELHEGEFSGIFLFEFDEKGRVCKHVIENSELDDGGESLAGVITVTEWLLKKAKGVPAGSTGGGGLAWQCERFHHGRL